MHADRDPENAISGGIIIDTFLRQKYHASMPRRPPSQSPNRALIQRAIKNLLKKQRQTYRDLAKGLGVSEPTIKRLMSRGDFTLDRLEQVARWFGFNLFELIAIARQQEIQPFRFSEKHESILAKNPKALYLALLFGAGFSVHEVKKRARLQETEFRQALGVLDRLDLIHLLEGDRVRSIARGPFQSIPNGKLARAYRPGFIKKAAQLVDSSNPKEPPGQISFETYLSAESLLKLQEDLANLIAKYRSLSRLDQEITPPEKFLPVTGLVLVRQCDTWRSVLLDSGL